MLKRGTNYVGIRFFGFIKKKLITFILKIHLEIRSLVSAIKKTRNLRNENVINEKYV